MKLEIGNAGVWSLNAGIWHLKRQRLEVNEIDPWFARIKRCEAKNFVNYNCKLDNFDPENIKAG